MVAIYFKYCKEDNKYGADFDDAKYKKCFKNALKNAAKALKNALMHLKFYISMMIK